MRVMWWPNMDWARIGSHKSTRTQVCYRLITIFARISMGWLYTSVVRRKSSLYIRDLE